MNIVFSDGRLLARSPSQSATRPLWMNLTWRERTSVLIAAVSLWRFVVGAATGLSDTEAYYLGWARVPLLSYYDHPPLVAWIAWLATRVSSAPWAVRLPSVAASAAFAWLVSRLTARLFSERAAFLAVAIVSLIPVFFFTGFLLNPEALLTPLWVLFLLLLWDLRDRDEPWRPLAVGLTIGVAFLAKYTAVLAAPIALLFLAASPAARRWLRRPSLYAAGIVALAVTTPVLVWNARNGWPTLALHLHERMGRAEGETLIGALWRVARGQLTFFSPLFLPALVGILGVTLARAGKDARYRFLALASAPVLAFLLTMMVRARDSEPHWTMVGYLPLAIAGGGILDEATGPVRRLTQVAVVAAVALSLAAAALYTVHLCTPALAKRLPTYDPAADPLSETVGWERVAAVVDSHARRLGPGAVVAGAHNVLCGHLQEAVDGRPPVYCASSRRTEFDFIGRRNPPAAAAVVFVDSERYPEDPVATFPDRRCGDPELVAIDRDGLHQALYRVRDCVPARPAKEWGGAVGDNP